MHPPVPRHPEAGVVPGGVVRILHGCFVEREAVPIQRDGGRRPEAVRKLAEKVFQPDFGRSRRISLEETRSATADLAEWIADQL